MHTIDQVLEELKKREPIFHREEFGRSRADFEKLMHKDFWEVGASGNIYNKDFILDFKRTNQMSDTKIRCFGGGPGKEFYATYHDHEWGIPSHDDRHLFELLILEGAQAGLSWETVLKKREGYNKAFHRFDPTKVAMMSDDELEALRHNPEIIRNRLKIYAARQNARAFLRIQQEFGSFDKYLWGFVEGNPLINQWAQFKDVPATTPTSDALSKDLKKRGMTFVGSTIMYAYMQAVGMVNDHLTTCWVRSAGGPAQLKKRRVV